MCDLKDKTSFPSTQSSTCGPQHVRSYSHLYLGFSLCFFIVSLLLNIYTYLNVVNISKYRRRHMKAGTLEYDYSISLIICLACKIYFSSVNMQIISIICLCNCLCNLYFKHIILNTISPHQWNVAPPSSADVTIKSFCQIPLRYGDLHREGREWICQRFCDPLIYF